MANNKDTIKCLEIDNKIIDVNNETIKACNAFNEYFTTIGSQLSKKFIKSHQIEVLCPNDNNFDTIFTKSVDKDEIIMLINNLKDETATGFDQLSVKLIKSISRFILNPIIFIYNKSLKEGIFPSQFKTTIVKPIFKNGNKKLVNNYRPISMINNLAKILEKIVKTRLMAFLENNKLLSKNQYGFRPGLGTTDALYMVSKNIYDALDNNKKTIAVFLDFAKAFDTVDHNELLKIMPGFGIVNESLKWFSSYLSYRRQMVTINGIIGNDYTINCGVPQGSVLGPVLFIIYINSICNMQLDGSIVTYADDTCLLFSDKTWEIVQTKAINELNCFIQKLNYKKITINYNKTFFMAFSIYNLSNFTIQHLKVCNYDNRDTPTYSTINRVTKIKYLGLMFDCNMRWNIHVLNIITRLRTITFKLYSLN